MVQIPSVVADVLDALHPSTTHPTSPAPGSPADLTAAGGIVLAAIMRGIPDDIDIADICILPTSGAVVLAVPDGDQAATLAATLDLPMTLRQAQPDRGRLCMRWSGTWSDHPVAIHTWHHEAVTPAEAREAATA